MEDFSPKLSLEGPSCQSPLCIIGQIPFRSRVALPASGTKVGVLEGGGPPIQRVVISMVSKGRHYPERGGRPFFSGPCSLSATQSETAAPPVAFLSHGTGVRIHVPEPTFALRATVGKPSENPKIQIPNPKSQGSAQRLDDLVGHDPDGHVHTQRIALRPIGVEVVQVVTFPLPAV